MASITIRRLDEDIKTRLRMRAAENHRSMEEEVRVILRDVVTGGDHGPPESRDVHPPSGFASVGGVDLELPTRGPDARASRSPLRAACSS